MPHMVTNCAEHKPHAIRLCCHGRTPQHMPQPWRLAQVIAEEMHILSYKPGEVLGTLIASPAPEVPALSPYP